VKMSKAKPGKKPGKGKAPKGKGKADPEVPAEPPPPVEAGGASAATAGGSAGELNAAAAGVPELPTGLFNMGGLEKFLTQIHTAVSIQEKQIAELRKKVESQPTTAEMNQSRDTLVGHLKTMSADKADKEQIKVLNGCQVVQDAKIAAMQGVMEELRATLANSTAQAQANAGLVERVRDEMQEHKANSVDTAKIDLLEFAQMQSCKEWRATGEKMEELNETMERLQRQVLDKADGAKVVALAERVGIESHRNQETSAAMENFTQLAATLEEGVALANAARQKDALAEFVTKDALDRLAKIEQAVDGVAKAQSDFESKAAKEKEEADKAQQEADEAKAKMDEEAMEAKEAAAKADVEMAEAKAAQEAARKQKELANKEMEDVRQAQAAVEKAKAGGDPAAIKAAEANLAREMGEAEESVRLLKEAEETAAREKAEAEQAKKNAEKEAQEAAEAKKKHEKEQAEADQERREYEDAADDARKGRGGGGGGGGASADEIARIDRTMERLAGKVLSCTQKVNELLGGGGGGGAAVQRLQEDLMLNTQKTENELDRMSEYLDKMSEQLAHCWEQKANATEMATIRADVDALLGQREGDVHQIKSVLQQMETTLRNPSLPSTAVGVHTATGAVRGVRSTAERDRGGYRGR
jgi:hypothetical protein